MIAGRNYFEKILSSPISRLWRRGRGEAPGFRKMPELPDIVAKKQAADHRRAGFHPETPSPLAGEGRGEGE